MKKYSFCFFAAIVILSVSVFTPDVMYASLPKVNYIKAELKNTEKTVTVQGKIASKQEHIQTSNKQYIISEILVESGDKVEKGDKIIKIDYEKTEQLYLSKGINYADKKYIVSEFSGTVNNIFAAENSLLNEGGQILSIIDPSELCAKLNISEDVFSNIKLSQNLIITGSAFKGRSYKGEITNIGAVATGSTISAATINAQAKIFNPDSHLKPGFTIKAKVIVKNIKNAVIIPSECVSQDNTGEFVYKLNGTQVQKQYIKTGEITPKGTVIKDGIKNGEYIASNPDTIQKNNSFVALQDK